MHGQKGRLIGVFSLYLLGISPTHFASFPHPFASFPHQICFVSPKKCFISPTVCCISPTKCFISPTVCCISLCNVVSRCQKIFYQIFSVFFYIFGIKFCLKFSGDSGIKRGGGGVGVKPTIIFSHRRKTSSFYAVLFHMHLQITRPFSGVVALLAGKRFLAGV